MSPLSLRDKAILNRAIKEVKKLLYAVQNQSFEKFVIGLYGLFSLKNNQTDKAITNNIFLQYD